MRLLLLPFAWLYGLIVLVRNLLYDLSVFKSYQSRLKTICIGNLQVGGSGKTPMTAYLYELFKDSEKIAVLSRGYGRKTKGLIQADASSVAETIGDEPLWYYKNLKTAKVVVSEKRALGLQFLESTDTTLVLLDDAMQHRAVKCNLNILLTEYRKPFYKDHLMPVGRLREMTSGAERAQVVVVTKCPGNIREEEMNVMRRRLKKIGNELVFFSTLSYGRPYALKGTAQIGQSPAKVFALCGLANPADFLEQCRQYAQVVPCVFRDHYNYRRQDIEKINALLGPEDIVICTEKDAVKLMDAALSDLVMEDRYFAWPVAPEILGYGKQEFKQIIKTFL